MKTSYTLLVGAILISVSSYIGTHNDIKTAYDLFGNMQNLSGLLGVIGSVLVGWLAKSPAKGVHGLIAKITSSGIVQVPKE